MRLSFGEDGMHIANPLVPGGVARWGLKPAGSFAVTDLVSQHDVTPRGRKAKAIIAYLSTQPGARIPREKLTDLLWGDRSEAQARASLRQALLEIRRSTGDLVQADRQNVWINVDSTSIDQDDEGIELFENLNHITAEFDEWLCGERERSRNDAGTELRHEVEKLLEGGRGPDALPLIEQMRSIDPYNEDALRLGMQAEFQAGHTAKIEQRFRETAELLSKDLGVLPAGETQALRDRLLGELMRVPESDPRQRSLPQADKSFVHGSPDSGPTRITPPVIDRRLVLAGGAAAVVAAGTGAWFVLKPRLAVASSRVAVLPFANLSGDSSQTYFSDGLAEELRTALSRIPALKVVARTSSEKVRNDDVKTAARKLSVGTIVTGSVRRSPSMIRVNAQLIDGNNGLELWSETYDRPAGDILQIQTDIAQNVAAALSIRLSPSTRATLTAGGTSNPTALDLVLQVERDSDSDSLTGIERRLALVNAALSLDPNYAEAYARKAALLMVRASVYERSAEASRRGLAQALAVVNRAIAIAPGMARGYTVRAHIYRNLLKIRPAWVDDKHAVSLPGENADVLDGYLYSLCTIGRPQEAVPLSEKLISLDPLGPGRYATSAYVQYCARHYAAAVVSARRSLQLAPSSDRTRGYLGYALLAQGKPKEAEAEFRKLEPTYYRRLVGEAMIAARAGQRSIALEKLRALQDLYADAAHYQYGQIYAQLGMTDEAFKEFELAWQVRDPGLASLRIDQFLDPIRRDPRFAALVRKLDFP